MKLTSFRHHSEAEDLPLSSDLLLLDTARTKLACAQYDLDETIIAVNESNSHEKRGAALVHIHNRLRPSVSFVREVL